MRCIRLFVAVYAMDESFASQWRVIEGVLPVIIYV
jgi:hypothetical protein